MRIQLARKNQEILNKVNGKLYRIMRVDAGEAVAYEIDKNNHKAVIKDSFTTITKENDICFRIMYDGDPYDVPKGYTVEDGIIMKNGAAVTEQGQIYVHQILAAVRGQMLLDTSWNGDRESHALKTYNPVTNKFHHLSNLYYSNVNIIPVFVEQDVVVLAFSDTREDVNEAGEPVTRFHGAELMVCNVKDSSINSLYIEKPFDIERVHVVKQNEDIKYILIPFNQSVLSDGVVVRCKEHTKIISVKRNNLLNKGDLLFKGLEQAAYCCYKNGLLLKSHDEIYFEGGSCVLRFTSREAVKALERYDWLVDVACAGHQTLVTFANEDYEPKTVILEDTLDRGRLVTIK